MKGDEAGRARASPDPRRRREGPRDARCASVLGEGTARGAQGRVGRGRRPALRGGEKALKGRGVEKAELPKGSPRCAHGRTGGPAAYPARSAGATRGARGGRGEAVAAGGEDGGQRRDLRDAPGVKVRAARGTRRDEEASEPSVLGSQVTGVPRGEAGEPGRLKTDGFGERPAGGGGHSGLGKTELRGPWATREGDRGGRCKRGACSSDTSWGLEGRVQQTPGGGRAACGEDAERGQRTVRVGGRGPFRARASGRGALQPNGQGLRARGPHGAS